MSYLVISKTHGNLMEKKKKLLKTTDAEASAMNKSKNVTYGVPILAQQKQSRLVTMRLWVQSLALLSGL